MFGLQTVNFRLSHVLKAGKMLLPNQNFLCRQSCSILKLHCTRAYVTVTGVYQLCVLFVSVLYHNLCPFFFSGTPRKNMFS